MYRSTRLRLLSYWAFLSLMFTAGASHATDMTIEITKFIEAATPVAIVPFSSQGLQSPPDQIADIIRNDLRLTGRFKTYPVTDLPAQPDNPGKVRYENWRILGAEALVIGEVQTVGRDRFNISFWLIDVYKGKQLEGVNITASNENFRAAAHAISDIIYERLTGEPGAFSTKIAYITREKTGRTGRNSVEYSLWIADMDGVNKQILLKSKEPLMSPTWSPDGQKIAYASLEERGAQRIFIQDWKTGTRWPMQVRGISKRALQGAPSWSPDGKKLAFHNIINGNAEIYVIDLSNKKTRRITKHRALDTEPSWTPDGKFIIFTSLRGGSPQLYKIPANGGRAKRLTFEGNENLRAAVSPKGNTIAMVHSAERNKYSIGILDLDSGQMNIITDGTFDESPSFAPNGSMILYATSKGRQGVLKAVSVDGEVENVLTFGEHIGEPAWSPINKN